MKRTKKQSSETEKENPKIKKKIKAIISSLSKGWLSEERETSILFDYEEKVVYLETSYPPTARRWFKNFFGDENVVWDTKANTLKFKVPWEYCRKADLILKPKYRNS